MGQVDRRSHIRLLYAMRSVLLLLAGCLAAACASPPEWAAPRPPEPARARAALATLHVENATAVRLTVSYRLATRPAAEVEVGRVPPATRAELAPVPAGEPLILIARTDAGAELALPPRTFELDGDWTWRIPAGSTFGPPASGSDP
jgi:hypothetical protein